MDVAAFIPLVGNCLAIFALAAYGFRLLAQYYSTGQWAKNVTSFFAGCGLLILALGLMLTPQNVKVLEYISHTKAPVLLLWISNLLLLGAITAFGVITYSRPLRLWHEHKLEKDLRSELPKIQ
ncbi:MAG: hypothetical protein JWO13_1827 [Acidobacteriales bacterium]|nr:hypothetical protein [Terriglobales bacterium]